MLGNNALESHPYYQKFVYQLRQRIQYWSSQGAITPQELQLMAAMAQNPGQQTIGFIQSLGVRYPNGITEEQMRTEIDETYLPAMRQTARQKLMMMGGGGMSVMGGMGMNGIGAMSRQAQPMTSFGSARSMAAGLFGELKSSPTVQKKEEPKEAPTTKLKEAEPPKPWKLPEFDQEFSTSKFTVCNSVNVLYGKFNLHDGSTCARMLISDPRLRYISDMDVIETFKPYFKTVHSTRKFVTIQYKQLKAVPVGREEMLKLANDVALSISKMENDLVARLKTIVSITRGSRYSFACSEAYNKLFCDEFDLHMQCGELTTMKNTKMVLNRFNSIADIVAFAAKEIDRSTVTALENIPDYYKTLNRIIDDIVYDLALNFSKKILDPNKYLAMLGSYMRALPPIWTTDNNLAMQGTDDLMELWVTSNVQINGSKTDGAVAAGSALKKKIEELDKQFTVFWVWRTTTWTDYPASSTVGYSETGECQPSTWNLNNPKTDIQFFVAEFLKAVEEGSDATKKRIPRSIYFEYEESTFSMNYGWTVDSGIWLGCSRYWK